MTNPTSNFGWQMPTPTDLVTDLPADFEVFGQAVDTSMADLKGGTTGQILSKATNTDMDFTWITNDVGDITAVTVSSPLTGGGTSGSVSVGILNGTTSNLGAVQLSDSTSSTSTTLAATANAVKTSYDLAAAAIAKSTVTTAGDIIYRNATIPVRLGIGTAGQVLKVNSGATAPEWATDNNKVIQVQVANLLTTATTTSTSYVDTGLTVTITPTSATSTILIQATVPTGMALASSGVFLTLANGAGTNLLNPTSPGSRTVAFSRFEGLDQYSMRSNSIVFQHSPASTSAQTYKIMFKVTGSTGCINRMGTDSNAADYAAGIATIVASEIGA